MQLFLSIDVAHEIMRDRLRQSAQAARAAQAVHIGLAHQARSAGPAAPRVWLAEGLRRLAVRLDSSVVCDPPCPAVASTG